MKLVLVMVTSLDGRSTWGEREGTHEWNSDEDKKLFQNFIKAGNLLIMGSSTYEGAREGMEHVEGRLRVVITRDPSKYEAEKILGKLEFSNEKPSDLVKRLESQGFSEGFLLGGAHANTEFFKQGLINELWLTLEPKILGIGNGILGEEMVNIDLALLSCEKLNDKGTLFLKYTVLR